MIRSDASDGSFILAPRGIKLINREVGMPVKTVPAATGEGIGPCPFPAASLLDLAGNLVSKPLQTSTHAAFRAMQRCRSTQNSCNSLQISLFQGKGQLRRIRR